MRISATALFSLCLLATAALAAPEEVYLKNVRQLTRDAEFSKAGEAYFSPDGKQILFQAVKPTHPYYQIYLMNADGSGARMVSPGKGKMTCAFFIPGQADRFVYASTHLDPKTFTKPKTPKSRRSYKWDYDGSFDVFIGQLSSGKIVSRLTEGVGYDAECSVSPDGKTIAYTRRREGKPDQIWLMDLDGKNKRALVDTPELACGGPFFSPDGEWVLYRATAPGSPIMHSYLVSLDGKTNRKLTTLPRVNWAPFFHPSGEFVAYGANMPDSRSNFDVIFVKADGSGREVQITFDKGFDGLPTFSPDGKQLMWTSRRGGGDSQVYVADLVLPPDSAYAVPKAPARNPHGGGAHGNPHGKNPHGANPHGGNPHSRPTSRPSNPHGGNPHGGASPHGNPHSRPTSRPSNPHGGDPHGSSRPGKDPHAKRATGPTVEPRERMRPRKIPGIGHIQPVDLQKDVAWLADDARTGRRAGTPGSRAAAGYMANRFAELGLTGGGPNGSFFHTFEFTKGGKLAATGNALSLDGKALTLDEGFRPLIYSASGSVTGKLAFVGYGITAPDEGYDDFAGVELDGAVAIVMTGAPRSQKGGAFGRTNPSVFQDLRYKIAACRDAGAAAVLMVRSSGEGWLRLSTGDPGLPVAQITRAALKQHLSLDVARMVAGIDMHSAAASEVLKQGARLSVKVERVKTESRNVIGKIKGKELPNEIIVIGAHYDHLGHGGEGSLSKEKGAIHNGADDNASGTAAVLALARCFSVAPPRRTILFVGFGAEEEGLIGSKHMVKDFDTGPVVAMLNMDMIGRLEKNKLLIGGYGTSKQWPALVQDAVDQTGRAVATQNDGFGPSDHASFYGEGVPVFFLWTGTHPDYHKPSDDTERVDFEGLTHCTRVAYLLTRGVDDLKTPPEYVKVARPKRPKMVATGERRAYFGSIPNYAQDGVTGVLLDGAREGTPAGDAGIQKGDIVVEFAGRKIANIYDYTNALRMVKPGQTVKVVVQRDGERVTLEATLGSR